MADWTPPQGLGGRWILACVGGAAAGMTLAALWNALLLPGLAPGAEGLPLLAPLLRALGGAVFGACLGAAQAAVLRGAYPGLPMGPWLAVTAGAGYLAALVLNLAFAGLSQFAGSIPIPAFILAGAALKGVLSGLLFGPAQGRLLDVVVSDRASWTRVVMVGFMLGALLGSLRWLLGPPSQDAVTLVVGALLGGALEGAALGVVTAGAFRFMPPRPAPRSPP
jgi:hypothetical protein